jgi:hypothetical protein
MVKEAESNAAEDKKRREAVDARNHADALIHSTEKSLSEVGDKVAAADKSAVESAIADLKGVLESGDGAIIKAKTDALTAAAMKIGEAMYKAQQEAAGHAQAVLHPERVVQIGVVDEALPAEDDAKTSLLHNDVKVCSLPHASQSPLSPKKEALFQATGSFLCSYTPLHVEFNALFYIRILQHTPHQRHA